MTVTAFGVKTRFPHLLCNVRAPFYCTSPQCSSLTDSSALDKSCMQRYALLHLPDFANTVFFPDTSSTFSPLPFIFLTPTYLSGSYLDTTSFSSPKTHRGEVLPLWAPRAPCMYPLIWAWTWGQEVLALNLDFLCDLESVRGSLFIYKMGMKVVVTSYWCFVN